MQSVLAYRKFGRRVEQQHQRHTNSAEKDSDHTNYTAQADAEHGFSCANPLGSSSGSTVVADDDYDANDEDPEVSSQRRRMRRAQTSDSLRLGHALTGVNVKTHDHKKIFVVGYENEDDDMNPHNWSYSRRIFATIMVGMIGWIVGFASAVDSAALVEAAKDFGVSEEAESLATGLFLVGFGVGSLISGPISETLGRNPIYLGTFSLYMVFVMASGLAPNLASQLVFRFFGGVFAATPLTCAGGSISDLWNPLERTLTFPIFANAAFSGPILAPVVGGFVAQYLNWRWVDWVTLIVSGAVLIAIILFQPETYAPILLKWKATHLRRVTGDNRYKAEMEIREQSLGQRLRVALYRPFLLTIREPIVALIALYLIVIYIILFTFLEGYNYIFLETYDLEEYQNGLCFLGILIGLFLASALVPFIFIQARKKQNEARARGESGPGMKPEFRLYFSMIGAPCIPISLFWMGWTSYASIPIWSPLAASILFGFGILTVFISSYQYIIDSYESYAASALAAATVFRYVAAGGMIEVAIPMYEKLGVHYTCTLLGGLSALLVPVPFLFYKYGEKIRGMSKFAI